MKNFTSKDINNAMNWYAALNTEELAKVYPHLNEMDSFTIISYWKKNVEKDV